MRLFRNVPLLAAVSLASVFASSAAKAALTINIAQSGSDVVATVNGNISAGRMAASPSAGDDLIYPSIASIMFAPGAYAVYNYFNVSGPVSWGPGGITNATSWSGDFVSLTGAGGTAHSLYVSTSYALGSPLSATDTFAGQTLASLGLTPGTYVYSVFDWRGAQADTVTVNVVRPGVPEPATWAMMLLGFAGIGFAMPRRQFGPRVKRV